MDEPKIVIEREDPTYWSKQLDSARNEAMQDALTRYVRYSKWYAGDMADLDAEVRRTLKCKANEVVSNDMTNPAVRGTLAKMMYRAPRAVVKPLNGFGPSKFTPELARVETRLINDWIEESNFLRVGRRAILDGIIGPYMCVKVGYTAEIDVDPEAILAERTVAQYENEKFATMGTKMLVKESDNDTVHIEEHRKLLDAASKGVVELSDKEKAYIQKHIKKHEEKLEKSGRQESETVRYERVFATRVNPLNVFIDPWADDFERASWVGSQFVRPIKDVEADTRYDESARMNVSSTCHKLENPFIPVGETTKDGEEFCRIIEIIDLKRKKVITFAEGCSDALLVRPYYLADILPSGPFIFGSFMENPLTDVGIPLPRIFESHQRAATMLSTLNMVIARRSLPKMVFAADGLQPSEIQKIIETSAAGMVPLTRLGKTGNINELFQQLPTLSVPQENFAHKADHEHKIEQLSGLGSAGMAGGDFAKTATASAVVEESVGGLADDFASVLDDYLQRILRAVLRLQRRFYPKSLVASLVGEDALDAWPDEWSVYDIVQDRGASVIPGSSKRKNAAVEQKMVMEGIQLVLTMPALAQNLPLQIELAKRLFDAMGLNGLDLEGAAMQAMIQQLTASVQAATPEGPRPSESKEPSKSGQAQGAANVGGGRVPTGASQGDKPRMMR